jgi:hypothetical protein
MQTELIGYDDLYLWHKTLYLKNIVLLDALVYTQQRMCGTRKCTSCHIF